MGLYRELEVISRLHDSLPDGFEVFHSVPIHSLQGDKDRYGELDAVVLGPTGNILLMEIKAGDVILREGSIFKLYSTREHDVSRQCRVQLAAMLNRLQEASLDAFVSNCLVIPDYRLGDAHLVSIPRDRIVDAERYPHLGTMVREFLSAGRGCSDMPRLRQFLRNEFKVTADIGTMRDQLERTVRQLADGLASWVPRISSPAGIYRIQATAGSGKTQLALTLMESAIADGKVPAYICFNRPLADHLRKFAPARAHLANFHELCVEHFRRKHGEPDFSDPTVFEKVSEQYLTDSESFSPQFDVLIIDEGQDFEPSWLESLVTQLKPDGQLYLMEDDDQRLYDRPAFELTDAISINCRDNFRTPRAICQMINAFGLASSSIQSKSPYHGALPSFHVFTTDEELITQTADAVEGLLRQGFALDDIVVLTGRGRTKSRLLSAEWIGNFSTRRFTGKYDRNGNPVWTTGQLLVESVYRYKGQSAPAVIVSELDFSELTPLERRKLFVGLTRAIMAVDVVLSPQTERCLAALVQ
ncbi:nuclease-like protein [Paucimonas lemoignei]|uniref:DNA 3'-5' helicase II n=1 Tax=Paucimonas lemoignei TaxID=29443 RepID=A0A4R3HU01_PAULE|nr:NERD domain-containing protein/DEAD/DEAH box helicase [Paucimonas lemoignei]TCS35621.1 nuclease-like protein [Paucimonas lemoignei]